MTHFNSPPKPASKKSIEDECAAALVAFLLLIPPLAYEGFVISNLWRWFVVPPTGFAEISAWGGAGISILVALLVTTSSYADEKAEKADMSTSERLARKITYSVVATTLVWGIGYLFYLFAPTAATLS